MFSHSHFPLNMAKKMWKFCKREKSIIIALKSFKLSNPENVHNFYTLYRPFLSIKSVTIHSYILTLFTGKTWSVLILSTYFFNLNWLIFFIFEHRVHDHSFMKIKLAWAQLNYEFSCCWCCSFQFSGVSYTCILYSS